MTDSPTPNQGHPEGLRDLIQGFELETLEEDAHSICVLSDDLTLIYLNPAWSRFGREHGQENTAGVCCGLGTNLASILPEPLRDFYVTAYRQTLATGEAWHHDYECSSPELFRLYHQAVYPLHNGKGLLVINSLCEERPHCDDRPAHAPDPSIYRSPTTGLVTQCCHCRRVQRLAEPAYWDWVPAWVAQMPVNTTSGLCPICYEYYWKYGAVRRP